eukprot:SAG31_NODE_325_length_17671_cov_9.902743_5_plen_191_part_00
MLINPCAAADYNFSKHAKSASPELKNLIQNMLQKDPAKRFTAMDVLHHPWVMNDPADPWTTTSVDKMLEEMGHHEVIVPEQVPDDPECWLKVQHSSPRPPITDNINRLEKTAHIQPVYSNQSAAQEYQDTIAERDALLELKREKEAREAAEAKAALARTRSAEKRAELEAAKAELAWLKANASGPLAHNK